MGNNSSLHRADKAKEDEFYTQISDIEKELSHYKEHFKDKTVLCNCDDPRISNFFKYFALKFDELGLNRLISTCYKNQDIDLFTQNDCEKAVWLDYYGNPNDPTNTDFSTVEVKELKGDGDFRSEECIELLKQADVVVTNPPFSLFREYVEVLNRYDKKFLIIGNQNAITYKEIFRLLKENKVWLGYKAGDMAFKVPDYYEPRATRYWQDETGQKWRSLGNICWFTNLDIAKRHEDLVLYKTYSETEYPKYDNYNAIEVSKTAEIPLDYDGIMGVPITFLDKYNPEQFEILGMESSAGYDPSIVGIPRLKEGDARPAINGKTTYARVFIKRKK
ncbi:MAG: adenine-specific methyltransferase EcoRI family protein [Treponema sp.]|nr:adenine-specific methyltransferase EcoRI family protein [Treponema sp.]